MGAQCVFDWMDEQRQSGRLLQTGLPACRAPATKVNFSKMPVRRLVPGLLQVRPGRLHFEQRPGGKGPLAGGEHFCLISPQVLPCAPPVGPSVHICHSWLPRQLCKEHPAADQRRGILSVAFCGSSLFSPGIKSKLNQGQAGGQMAPSCLNSALATRPGGRWPSLPAGSLLPQETLGRIEPQTPAQPAVGHETGSPFPGFIFLVAGRHVPSS